MQQQTDDENKMTIELKKYKTREETLQNQIVMFKSQIKHLEQERSELYSRVSQLEEELSTIHFEKDKEIQYWQQRLEKEQNQYETTYKLLQQQSESDKNENELLRSKNQILQSKGTMIHSPQIHNEQVIDYKKKNKVVTTPTKKDLNKYSNYEVMDVVVNHSLNDSIQQSPITTLFKGQVQKSVTGDGYSVVLTDMEVHTKDSVTNTPIKNNTSRLEDVFSPHNDNSPPVITLSPPNENNQSIIFVPLHEEIVMHEIDEDEFLEISLDDENIDKKDKKKRKEKKEKEVSSADGKNKERFWKKGKDIAMKVLPLPIRHSPSTPRKEEEYNTNLEINDKENSMPENKGNEIPKKRGRKLFSSKTATDDLKTEDNSNKRRKSVMFYNFIYC